MNRADLIDRLEKLTGPDREVDALITATLGDISPSGLPRCAGYIGIGAFTASVDAAVALVERCLPGWGISLGINIKSFGAGLWEPKALGPRFHGFHPSTAIALLIALFRALEGGSDA